MLANKFCKQVIYKSTRLALIVIILFTVASFLKYLGDDDKFIRKIGLTAHDNDENSDRIKIDLDQQIIDLKNTKESLEKELTDLESKKGYLIVEVKKIEDAIEKESSKVKNLDKSKKASETESLGSKLQFNTVESCFNYQKCVINSKINVYFFDQSVLPIAKNVDNVFEVVSTVDDACLTIFFIKTKSDAKYVIENISILKGKGNNLVLVNLINNYNLFMDSFEMSSSTLNELQCSLYASFNYFSNNEIYKNRLSSLFFHFAFADVNLNEDLSKVYDSQRQNKLLLTHKRKYILTYFESTITRVKREVKKNFNQINCDISDSQCIKSIEILEILSNTSYLLIDNKNASDSILWTVDITERLIESLSVGTIPLIVDIDSKLPLNDLINWDEVVVRIPVNQIASYEFFLNSINEADLINRRIKATKIYKRYFKNPQSQFNTLITAIRERIRLPPAPIDDYVVEDIDNVPVVANNISIDMSLYNDKSIRINTDEYLGPVNKDAETIALHQSKSFQFNRTFNSYFAWNHQYYPFNMMPSTPFDKFLPIDLKYTSIKAPTNTNKNYFYGGTRGGEFFHEKLGGNQDDNEQFTIIILTFNRERLLISVLLEYFKLPYLNQIIVVWNSVDTKPTDVLYLLFKDELKNKQLRIVFGKKNSLGDRFLPYNFIRTDAIISLDDDTQLRNDEIIFAFRVWRENRERLVGFPARFHSWDPVTKSFRYRTELSCEYSLILTGAAIYHRYYHYYYHYLLDNRIRAKIDEFMNCEDIAFNFMISDLTRKPPIKVTSKSSFNCKLCKEDEDVQKSLSSTGLHYERRSTCINYFNLVYGYNPLLYSQSRSDSVLYKSSIGKGMTACFEKV